MDTILAPTDFSPVSEGATRYAAALAQRLGCSLCLVHAYQVPVSINEVPAVPVPVDELRQHAQTGLQRIAYQLRGEYPELEITVEERMGDVVEELRELCAQRKPRLIVTGHHAGSGLERALFGSTSLSIIHQLNVPLVAVPEGYSGPVPQRVALALGSEGTKKGEYLRDLGGALGAELLLVHVQTDEKSTAPFYFDQQVHTVIHEKFIEGIEAFVQQERIDLLIVLPHHHNLIERWFFKTHTPQVVNHLAIPVMCVPE